MTLLSQAVVLTLSISLLSTSVLLTESHTVSRKLRDEDQLQYIESLFALDNSNGYLPPVSTEEGRPLSRSEHDSEFVFNISMPRRFYSSRLQHRQNRVDGQQFMRIPAERSDVIPAREFVRHRGRLHRHVSDVVHELPPAHFRPARQHRARHKVVQHVRSGNQSRALQTPHGLLLRSDGAGVPQGYNMRQERYRNAHVTRRNPEDYYPHFQHPFQHAGFAFSQLHAQNDLTSFLSEPDSSASYFQQHFSFTPPTSTPVPPVITSSNNRRESVLPVVLVDEVSGVEESNLRGEDDLRVGKAINLFSRYGFLTLSVKVRPPVGEDNFLFLENTAEVFQKNSYWGKRETRRHRGNYDDHFYIHFCEDLGELLIAYFDQFTIEGVQKAHKAFTSSLSVRDLARQFGINSTFLTGPFSFVLVRLFRRKRRSTLKGPLDMEGGLKAALQQVRLGSAESVHQFVDRYGSHVITEFEVGDMMYQTFVFGDRLYKELKNKFAVVTSENHLEELQQYFTPNYAANVGKVLLASGNDQLDRLLDSRAGTQDLLLYPNIFRVFEDPDMEAALGRLAGSVVLSLKLDKITSRLPRSPETRWMNEVLDNTLSIYYQHMSSTRKNL